MEGDASPLCPPPWFQFSIGDANIGPIREAAIELVSILHWRCWYSWFDGTYHHWFVKTFQFSIGDAIKLQNTTQWSEANVSILHWRCRRGRSAVAQNDGHVCVSILHWRCPTRSSSEPSAFRAEFQFSIGDATRTSTATHAYTLISCFNSPLEMPYRDGEILTGHREKVSILHWRCRVSWTMDI